MAAPLFAFTVDFVGFHLDFKGDWDCDVGTNDGSRSFHQTSVCGSPVSPTHVA